MESYDRFARLIEKKGVRPIDVARATGVSSATLSLWKKGHHEPKAGILSALSTYFNVPVSYFYGEEPKEEPSPEPKAENSSAKRSKKDKAKENPGASKELRKIRRAVREYCTECSGDSEAERNRCETKNCPLWPYRK